MFSATLFGRNFRLLVCTEGKELYFNQKYLHSSHLLVWKQINTWMKTPVINVKLTVYKMLSKNPSFCVFKVMLTFFDEISGPETREISKISGEKLYRTELNLKFPKSKYFS